jgi:hypothetical protein
MKKNQLKSLELKKKSIARITSDKINGGWTTTIQTLTDSCPHVCGSQK